MKVAGIAGASLIIGVALLLIPEAQPQPLANPGRRPFRWNHNALLFSLERRFDEARGSGCRNVEPRIDADLSRGMRLLRQSEAGMLPSAHPVFDSILQSTFDLGPLVAACVSRLPGYLQFVTRTRSMVKWQSRQWNLGDQDQRDRLYRLLYGGRAALEEVMLQAPIGARPALVLADPVTSATPATRLLGVEIHSGDILVSRGGAPTSALIAVGNDYPGVFSHDALVHVDERTSVASVIESNSPEGVRVHNLEEYLREIKLRVMVLRVRPDLPAVSADPQLPHRAATFALEDARRNPAPYDFALNQFEHSRMYCSELLTVAYGRAGVRLWMGLSSISSPGITAWLGSLGISHLEPQEPSDLEYDPQLQVVAEWRDQEALYADHVDNVVTEAMLNAAQRGDRLEYPWYLLPVGRVLKGYSTVRGVFGEARPIPDGMSTGVALRLRSFTALQDAVRAETLRLAADFTARKGYVPPEWELLRLARQARAGLPGGS